MCKIIILFLVMSGSIRIKIAHFLKQKCLVKYVDLRS